MQRKIHVVDTNVILRWLTRDHEVFFEKAAAFWAQVQAGVCFAYIPEGILVECLFVLIKTYGVPRAEAARQIGSLLTIKGVVVDSRDEILAALHLLEKYNISFADGLVIAHARAQDAAIQTFDQDLLKAAKRG